MTSRNFFRAPFHIRYSRKSDFEPKLVSIGPHFYEQKDYPTDKEKSSSLRYFLEKETAVEKIIDILGLVERLDDDPDMERKIYAWYGGRDKVAHQWKILLSMLVTDSCFIIRIIVYLSREANHMLSPGVDVEMLRFELLLLENQIPLFFLKKVYDFLDANQMLPPKPGSVLTDPAALNTHETARPSFWVREPRSTQQPTSDQGCAIPVAQPISEHEAPQPTSEQDDHIPQPTSEQTPELTSEEHHILQPPSEQTSQLTSEEFHMLQPPLEQSHSPHAQPTSEHTNENLDQFLEELKPFICLGMPWQFNEKPISKLPDHLLDLYWKRCLPSDLEQDLYSRNHDDNTSDHVDSSWDKIHILSNADKRIPNARALEQKAGVTFEKRKHDKGFGVEFHKGSLQLPHLKLDQNQTTLLVNLIAFEEFKPSKDRVLTSYILLLDGLINTKKDAELLHSCGVITNKLRSIEMVSTFFNDMGSICRVDYENHYCKDQFNCLNYYYRSSWRYCGILRHEHFKSPWAVISLLAGTSLLIMAGLQTGYIISDFYHPHH